MIYFNIYNTNMVMSCSCLQSHDHIPHNTISSLVYGGHKWIDSSHVMWKWLSISIPTTPTWLRPFPAYLKVIVGVGLGHDLHICIQLLICIKHSELTKEHVGWSTRTSIFFSSRWTLLKLSITLELYCLDQLTAIKFTLRGFQVVFLLDME